jgi:hypothetical protein
MIWGHCTGWWMAKSDAWTIPYIWWTFDWLEASAFLFLSGISTSFSLRGRLVMIRPSDSYLKKQLRNGYMLRALFILIIALIYNLFNAIVLGDFTLIWAYRILFTIAWSLILAWPLFKTSKAFRLCLAGGLWIGSYFLVEFLMPYKGQANFYGIIYFFLYNPLELDPIVMFFSFFLIGTVVGDIIVDVYNSKDKDQVKKDFKKKLFYPSLVGGVILIVFSYVVSFWMVPFKEFDTGFYTPQVFVLRTIPWCLNVLGMILVFTIILLYIEEFEIIKTKKSHRCLYYFSFYSFTVYIFHNLLYFVFLGLLPVVLSIISAIITVILSGFLLKFMFNKWGKKLSVKSQIGILSSGIIKRRMKVKRNKN